MALFEGQRILVISPQPWTHIHLSKHNYAIELARRGNKVLFLDPPDDSREAISVDEVPEYRGLKVIRYRSAAPLPLRFHARRVFDFIQRRQVEKMKQLMGPIDVVWCFDFNAFSDLSVFDSGVRIFHPVDPVTEQSHIDVARTADIIISVSEEILSSFKGVGIPAFVIDHGLAKAFADRSSVSTVRKDGPLRIGYSGNLARTPLNRAVLMEAVSLNHGAEFHFFGPTEVLSNLPDQVKNEIDAFVGFLNRAPNVTLHGNVSSEELADALNDMDCFILSYVKNLRESDLSNSHKILEYLSTGKVVVSSHIGRYRGRSDLVRMATVGDDASIPELLSDTLSRLDEFNSVEIQQNRRAFALDRTYDRQVDRIRDLILSERSRQ